jgi:acetylornithine/N-succinyldiaminopimelate aminotransferase
MAMTNDALMQTYARLPVAFTRGEGAWLWDTSGKRYLDAVAGVAVCGLGHAHPEVAEAICEQARALVHTSNLYQLPLQAELGARLTGLAAMERAFFCNSGAEANEAAIKLARMYGHKRGVTDPAIVVAEGSFHGRTLATLSATGSRKVQAGFEPLVRGFKRAPYNDIDAIAAVARHSTDVVAIMVEPVQGENGVIVPEPGYLRRLRELCDENEWLLMLDEIQTGMCRTGRWFACNHEDVAPDVITLAKALGNGVPIGACLAQGAAAEVLHPGSHGSTFGGNPLACRAALTVIDVLEREGIAERVAHLGTVMLGQLRERLAGMQSVRAVRGLGLMFGIELDRPCQALVGRALEQGVLINVTRDNTIRLLPPLVISDEQAAQIVDTVVDLVSGFEAAA